MEAPARQTQLDANSLGSPVIPSHYPQIFTPDALPATTIQIYSGLGQAQNMLACISHGLVFSNSNSNKLLQVKQVVKVI